jgi:hypothetical protein
MANDFVILPPVTMGELADGRTATIGVTVLSTELTARIVADEAGAMEDLYAQVRAALIALGGA